MEEFSFSKDISLIAPLIVLFLFSIVPITVKVMRGNREIPYFASIIWAFLGLLGASGLTFSWVNSTLRLSGKPYILGFSNMIIIDGMGIWLSYLIYFLAGVALLMAYDHVTTRGKQFSELLFLLLNSVIGMILMIMSNDLLMTFVALEFMSLTLYLVIAVNKDQVLSKEASFKYFILGSMASAVFLYGISFVYGAVGSTNLFDLALSALELFQTNKLFTMGFVLVALGFCFKIAAFPLHAWAPDVYHGAPTPVTTLMSTAVKAVSFMAFLRLFAGANLVNLEDPIFLNIMQWLAVLTMIVGNVGAIRQDNVKRMLAYSSVAHSGYMMVGLIAAGFGTNFAAGTVGLLFYIFTYSVMTVGTFALVALFEKTEQKQLTMDGLRGLARRHRGPAIAFFILMISLAGIPPTLGFFGKFYLFAAAVEQGFLWLALWGVINSVISGYYYLRPVVYMFMSEESGDELMTEQVFTRATLVVSAIVIVLLGIMSTPLFMAVQNSVMAGL